MFSGLKAFTDKCTTTDTKDASEVLKPTPIKERAEISPLQERDVSNEFEAPVVKLDWEEILDKVSIILASAQPVKYFHQVEGTGQVSRPLFMVNGTESVATFSDWLMAGKNCMAIGKDGIAHWFLCDIKAGTLRYSTTFGCDYT